MKSKGQWKQRWVRLKHLTGYDHLSPTLKKVLVGVFGTLVLMIGLVMLVLPGPAIVFIPLGLAILASEFKWARRILLRVRIYLRAKRQQFKERRLRRSMGGAESACPPGVE